MNNNYTAGTKRKRDEVCTEIKDNFSDRFLYILKSYEGENWERNPSVLRFLHLTAEGLYQMLSGTKMPSAFLLVQISKYYGVSTDFLLGLTDNEKPNK